MKTTKVIEIEVCDQCGEEVRFPPLTRCLHCGKEVCTTCQWAFTVDVRETVPRRLDIGHGETWATSVRHVDEFRFYGVFCGPCGGQIGATLTAAGLAKTQSEEASPGIVLDSANSM